MSTRTARSVGGLLRTLLLVGAAFAAPFAISGRGLGDDGQLVEVRILFEDARLVVEDGTTARIIVEAPTAGEKGGSSTVVLVPSSEFRVHRLAPGLYQVIPLAESDRFWRVNALGSTVWSVGNGLPGIDGGGCDGNYIRYPSWMEVVPPSGEDARAGDVQVRIRDLELVLNPRRGTLLLQGGGSSLGPGTTLSRPGTWEFEQVGAFHFHARPQGHWNDRYLVIDAGGKEARLARRGVKSGAGAERGQVLDAPVQTIRRGGRYEGHDVPVLLEPEEGAILDNGCSQECADMAVWEFRWAPVDGAELYELEANTFPLTQVRQPRHIRRWRGQGYGPTATGWWRVRAVREGRRLPWSERRSWADIEPYNTDRAETLIDYLVDESMLARSADAAPAPTLRKPKPGAMLDNGRADGLDSISWRFEWRPVTGHREYEILIVRGIDRAPFLHQRVRGTRFTFQTDEYRIFGYMRMGWIWRVRTLGGGSPGPWSAMQRFDVEPLDTDPPRARRGSGKRVSSPDVPVLLRPKPGAGLESAKLDHSKSYDPIEWVFRWKEVPEAEAYEFEYGTRGTAWSPKLNARVEGTSFKQVDGPTRLNYGGCDWYWRVRAVRGGEPLPWSERRPFDVVVPGKGR